MKRCLLTAAALAAIWGAQTAWAQEAESGIPCRGAVLKSAPEGEEATETAAKRKKKGLVLHYAFGRGGAWKPGAAVKDLSGQGHDGRVEGDGLEVVKGMGPKGRAARFDGKGDFIRVPRDEALEPEAVTVAAWVRVRKEDRSAGEDGIGVLVFKRNSSFHDNEDYCMEIHPNHAPQGEIANPRGTHSRVPAGVSMAPDLWHHVALTTGNGEIRVYVDGKRTVSRSHPYPQDHNPGADLFIGTRDHASYPLGHFGAFDLAELKIWDEALDEERVAALYRERAGRAGVAKPEDNRAPAVERSLLLCGDGMPPVDPPRMFPPWTPGKLDGKAGAAAELRALVAQGRRDRAASPEFLAALEGLAGKWERDGRTATDRLPMAADWRESEWPAGWEAVRRDVWRFGGGEARQVESRANTRYVLFYEPGKAWTDYTATVRFESDQWFAPPMRSSAWLYFRYHGVDDSFVVQWDGEGDISLVSLEKGRQGKERVLSRIPVDRAIILDGKPWSVKVRGEEIEVWHEGKRYLFATDGAHPSGTVGVESVHIPMRFSGLEVR